MPIIDESVSNYFAPSTTNSVKSTNQWAEQICELVNLLISRILLTVLYVTATKVQKLKSSELKYRQKKPPNQGADFESWLTFSFHVFCLLYFMLHSQKFSFLIKMSSIKILKSGGGFWKLVGLLIPRILIPVINVTPTKVQLQKYQNVDNETLKNRGGIARPNSIFFNTQKSSASQNL